MSKEAHDPLSRGTQHGSQEADMCFLQLIHRHRQDLVHGIPEDLVREGIRAWRFSKVAEG